MNEGEDRVYDVPVTLERQKRRKIKGAQCEKEPFAGPGTFSMPVP
jgi:hypothetical protein